MERVEYDPQCRRCGKAGLKEALEINTPSRFDVDPGLQEKDT